MKPVQIEAGGWQDTFSLERTRSNGRDQSKIGVASEETIAVVQARDGSSLPELGGSQDGGKGE